MRNWCVNNIDQSVTIPEVWIQNAKYLNPLAVCGNKQTGDKMSSSLESIKDWFEYKINTKLIPDKLNVRGKNRLDLYKLAYDLLKILETLKH